MFQARNGAQNLGLPGKRCLSVLAVPPENPDPGHDVTQRLLELLELYARNHFVEGSMSAESSEGIGIGQFVMPKWVLGILFGGLGLFIVLAMREFLSKY